MKASMRVGFLAISVAVLLSWKTWAQEGSWDSLAPLPEARGFCATAVVDNQIYVIGGFNDVTKEAIASMIRYDPITQSWETMADLPVPLARASAGVLDGKIYVTGGHRFDSGSELHRWVYQYDPQTNLWTRKADMLKPRWYHATAVLDGKMYIMGGRTTAWPSPIDSSVEAYDPKTDQWIFAKNMRFNRGAFTAETIGNKIFAFGGADRSNIFASVERFDPETDEWSELSPMPTPRWGQGSVDIDGVIYQFGGASNVVLPDMIAWDFINEWSDIGVNMPDSVSGFSYAVIQNEVGDKCIYAIGGVRLDYWVDGSSGPYTSPRVRRYCLATTATRDRLWKDAISPLAVFPNPVNVHATIEYSIKKMAEVKIEIIDIFDRDVVTIAKGVKTPGIYRETLDVGGLSRGIYFCIMVANGIRTTQKLVVTD